MFFKSKHKIVQRTLASKKAEVEKINLPRALFFLLIIIFSAVLMYILFFSSFLQIRKITIQGLEELEYARVLGWMNTALEQKYLRFIAKNNILLIQPRELEKALTDDFKKISSVKIQKVFPDTLVVLIQERRALLIWCYGEECSMVDENGFAYAPADFDSPEVVENNLIVVRDLSRSSILAERAVLNPEIVDFILAMQKEMKARLDLELNREFETPKSISGDIVAVTSEGWKIRLNKELGAAKEVEMLQLVLNQNISQEKRADLEYVDLRTEGKVYYKLKSAPPEESSVETERVKKED